MAKTSEKTLKRADALRQQLIDAEKKIYMVEYERAQKLRKKASDLWVEAEKILAEAKKNLTFDIAAVLKNEANQKKENISPKEGNLQG